MKKSLLRLTCSAAVLFGIGAALAGCARVEKHARHFFGLDTGIDVTVYSASSRAEADIDSFEALTGRLEDMLSISKQSSVIWRINHRPDSLASVSAAFSPIIAACRKEYALSGGLFDVTVEPFKTLYGLESHQRENHVPSQAEIDSVLALTGFGRVRFVSDSVLVLPRGMHFDFGGIAKGFVLREATKFFSERGHASFLVNLGGDLVAYGTKPSNEPWVIGIQDPRDSVNLIATLSFTGGCVFTSGDYERCFIVNGKRYHHLFDPKTGKPGSLNMSATVTGRDPLAVDAAIKTAFLMPAEKALEYLSTRNMLGFLIDSTKTGWASAGLKQSLTPNPGFVVNYR
ncbi:MAG TPA: FAD:protein FMN transferase [Chitinivibrionales bacterium]|nr:FAD:protein FMN transferase [Chitinivibrionales bacterium]